jgi:hypothetical protein
MWQGTASCDRSVISMCISDWWFPHHLHNFSRGMATDWAFVGSPFTLHPLPVLNITLVPPMETTYWLSLPPSRDNRILKNFCRLSFLPPASKPLTTPSSVQNNCFCQPFYYCQEDPIWVSSIDLFTIWDFNVQQLSCKTSNPAVLFSDFVTSTVQLLCCRLDVWGIVVRFLAEATDLESGPTGSVAHLASNWIGASAFSGR